MLDFCDIEAISVKGIARQRLHTLVLIMLHLLSTAEVRGNGANTGVPIKDQIASGSLNPSTLPLIDEILLKASSTGGTFLDLGVRNPTVI